MEEGQNKGRGESGEMIGEYEGREGVDTGGGM